MQVEREVLAKALVGSHNYNLATPESDKDYKVFVMPTFEDLYHGKMYAKAKVGELEDYDVHDVRKLIGLFWKANLNFLEVLFSTDLHIYNEDLKELFRLRDEIVKMNLPYLYNACRGMHFEKMKRLDKASEGTAHLVEKYGYNTKEALHAHRCLDFLTRFASTEFDDFGWAMKYGESTWKAKFRRDQMLDIKHGAYAREDFEAMMRTNVCRLETVAPLYFEKKPNEELKQHIESIIYRIVEKSLQGPKKISGVIEC